MAIEFTWDPEKARLNLAKHGVSFETATQVFFDAYLVVSEDCEFEGEVRYQAIGHTTGGQRLLVVVFVDLSDEEKEIIRIISAREAEKYEQRTYSDQFEEGN